MALNLRDMVSHEISDKWGTHDIIKWRTSVTNSPLMSWCLIYPLSTSDTILPTLTVLAGYNTEGRGQLARDRGYYALLYRLASPV